MKTKLLTTGNAKTAKSTGYGYLTFILHLSPARSSGHEVCAWRTPGCTALCLDDSGHAAIYKPGEKTNAIHECRIRRTRMFFEDREAFMRQLAAEITAGVRYAAKRDLTAVFRLNGTSDIVWEHFPVTIGDTTYANIFAAFPDVQFYDYTKAPYAARRHDIPNYHLTFSFAETLKNRENAAGWSYMGHSVSVVFDVKRGSVMPTVFEGQPVYDADKHDLRFLDSKGIAGLRVKGNKWRTVDSYGFVVRAS